MNASVRLLSVRGIEVGINWSWLVVFALIVWTLATGILPEQNPGLSDESYLAMALVAAALFFASLLAHELGHALRARREGMAIDGITLWLFGGVAKFRGMFPSAGAQFRIAIAGPLVALALGLLFSLLARHVELPAAVDGVAAWLGYTNLTLLVFNLLPALPLEAGSALREDEPAVEALAKLSQDSVGRGLVLDGRDLAGLLSLFDLARVLDVPGRRTPLASSPT